MVQYVGGQLTFYDDNKKPIHKVRFDIKHINDFKKLLRLVQLKD